MIIGRIRYTNIFGDYARGVAEGTAAAAHWEEMLAAGLESTAAPTLRTQLLQLQFNIGVSLLRLSQFTKSRELHARVREEQARLLGADHPHTLMTAVTLAADLRALGLYRDAAERAPDAYQMAARAMGRDSGAALEAQVLLGIALRSAGQAREAQPHFDEALSPLGADHPSISTLRENRRLLRALDPRPF